MSEPATEPATEAGSDDAQAQQMLAEAMAATAEKPDQPQPTQTPAEPKPDTGTAAKGTDWESEASKWKALARKHETTAKANASAAQKYAEFEESQKTEQQRLTDRLAAVEQERDKERQGRARLMAAATHSLSPNLIDRIGGTTEEEINESAEALAEEIKRQVAEGVAAATAAQPAAPTAPGPTRPVESLTPGAKPSGDRPTNPNDYLRDMADRTRGRSR